MRRTPPIEAAAKGTADVSAAGRRGVPAYVGLGSNLADPARQIARAVRALAALPRTTVVATSSLYRTSAIGVAGRQPDYLNAVVLLRTALSPDELLRGLQAIERAHRRRRAAPSAPRTIDLDLLLYGALDRRGRKLVLPHPRLHRRAFVLEPLLEIAPDASIPGRGRARRHLPRVRRQRVTRIARHAR